MTALRQTVRGMIRRFRPDHNPLRRTADRVEAAILAGLTIVLLVAGPLAGTAVASVVSASGARTAHAQASWRQTGAVLLRTAPVQIVTPYQAAPEPSVLAAWTAPDGTRHTGDVAAPGGTKAGVRVPVWTDRAGHLEPVPEPHSDTVVWEVLAALAAGAGVLLLVSVAGGIARFALDRRRLAAWDAAWPVAVARWSGRA